MLWALLAAGLVTVFLVAKRKGGLPVLRARIRSPEGGGLYVVGFEQLSPEMKPVEHIHLVLGLAAKWLYLMGNQGVYAAEKAELLRCLEALGNRALDGETSSYRACGRADVPLHEMSDSDGRYVSALVAEYKEFAVTVAFVDVVTRTFHTSIPLHVYPNQFLDSWLAVVQATVRRLDPSSRELLTRSLGHLAQLYATREADPSSLSSLTRAPSIAFVRAGSQLR